MVTHSSKTKEDYDPSAREGISKSWQDSTTVKKAMMGMEELLSNPFATTKDAIMPSQMNMDRPVLFIITCTIIICILTLSL